MLGFCKGSALLIESVRFVATVLHPVFFLPQISRGLEVQFDRETGERQIIRTMTLRDYLHVPPFKGQAVQGQPRSQVRLFFSFSFCGPSPPLQKC